MGELRAEEGPGGDRLFPVVRATVGEGLGDHGVLQEAPPSRGRGHVLLDGGQEPRVQLGVLRLDAAGDPAGVARRAPARAGGMPVPSARPGPRTRPAGRRSSARIAASPRPIRAQADQQRARLPQRSHLADPPRDPFQRLSQFLAHDAGASARVGRVRPSHPASQVSTMRVAIAARISGRQSFWRPSSSAFFNCRAALALGLDPRRALRQAAAELLQGLGFQGGRLALRRPEVDGERARASGSVDGIDAGCVRPGERPAPRLEPGRRAVRLADRDGPLGERHVVVDEDVRRDVRARSSGRPAGPTSGA